MWQRLRALTVRFQRGSSLFSRTCIILSFLHWKKRSLLTNLTHGLSLEDILTDFSFVMLNNKNIQWIPLKFGEMGLKISSQIQGFFKGRKENRLNTECSLGKGNLYSRKDEGTNCWKLGGNTGTDVHSVWIALTRPLLNASHGYQAWEKLMNRKLLPWWNIEYGSIQKVGFF